MAIHPTDEHLKPLEKAARLYCQMRGDDPDEEMPAPHPDHIPFPYHRPVWLFAAEKLLDLNQMLVALKRAGGAPDGSNGAPEQQAKH